MFTAFQVDAPAAGDTPVEVTADVTIDQPCVCKVISPADEGVAIFVGNSDVTAGAGFPVPVYTEGSGAVEPLEFRLLPGDQVYAISNAGTPPGSAPLNVLIYSAPQ